MLMIGLLPDFDYELKKYVNNVRIIESMNRPHLKESQKTTRKSMKRYHVDHVSCFVLNKEKKKTKKIHNFFDCCINTLIGNIFFIKNPFNFHLVKLTKTSRLVFTFLIKRFF